MALDLQLYHKSWRSTPRHNAERTWLLCAVIDSTKSAQRGRVPSINSRLEESIRAAYEWLPEEPEALLLVHYAVR